MPNPEIEVKIVTEPTEELSIGLGLLMPDLSSGFTSQPIELEILSGVIESKTSDLFIASRQSRIVGSGVMNLIQFTSGKKAWLEDFVVSSDSSLRNTGIGYALWQEFVAWAVEREAPIEFTSSEQRQDAHKFYFRQGAEIKPTSVFEWKPTK